jgi:hypothetical protein
MDNSRKMRMFIVMAVVVFVAGWGTLMVGAPLGTPPPPSKSCPKDNDDKDNGRHVSGLRNLFFGNDDKDKNDKDKNDKDKNGHDNCGKGDDSRSFSRY